ncbi:MAG: hypothetical protein H6Q65_2237 [Firmicutes bacterium]|nr:hypothetical protein [Bacillota bacterium]
MVSLKREIYFLVKIIGDFEKARGLYAGGGLFSVLYFGIVIAI